MEAYKSALLLIRYILCLADILGPYRKIMFITEEYYLLGYNAV
jgi:hypothetical protein